MRWLVNNIGSLLLALAMAMVVWTVAVLREDPVEIRVFQQSIPIELIGQSEDTVLIGTIPQRAEVTLRGPDSVLDTLTANQVSVVADISAVPPGEATEVPLTASVSNLAARVTAVSPDRITVTLEQVISRSLPIALKVSGEPATGYEAGEPVLTPDTIEIRGPASLVERVEAVTAQLSLQDVRDPVDTLLRLTPVDLNEARVNGVTLSPDQARVTVAVKQLFGFREVAVSINITGNVPFGYRLDNLTVSPPVVTLFSTDPTLVTQMPGFVETQPIDLTGLTDDVNTNLALELPDGVDLVGDQTVLVQVSVSAILGSLPVQREIELSGLGQGLAAEPVPATVNVILSGPLPILDALQPEDVIVRLDLLGLEEGVYQLTPEVVILPDDITVDLVLPSTIEVTIKIAPTITPGPSPTPTPTITRTPTITPTRTLAPFFTRTPSPTPSPTLEPTPTETATPTPG